jgi:hypothetical protein
MSENLLRVALVAAGAATIMPATAFADDGDHDGKNDDCHVERGLSTTFNATVAPAGIAANGFLFFGAGNPPTGFAQQEDPTTPLELDLNLIFRTGDTIQPAGVTSCGEIIYRVPAGPQVIDPAHDVTVANPNRAAWNFNYAVVLGDDGGLARAIPARPQQPRDQDRPRSGAGRADAHPARRLRSRAQSRRLAHRVGDEAGADPVRR